MGCWLHGIIGACVSWELGTMTDLDRWVAARCLVDPNERQGSSELYLDYLQFLGYRTVLERVRSGKSQKRFVQELLAKYPCVLQKSNTRRIVGIHLIEVDPGFL